MKGFAILLLVSAAVATPTYARAENEKAECVAAHVAGQAARVDGKLRAARDRFASCAREACPSVVKTECSQLLSEVDEDLSSVVLVATEEGRVTNDIRVFVDGELLAESVEGPIAVDPGERTVRVESRKGAFFEKRVIFVRREKARRLRVDLPSIAAAAVIAAPAGGSPIEPPAGAGVDSRVTPPIVYVLGAVGIAGLATFGTFALLGKQRENDLAVCARTCAGDEVDGMYTRYLVADIALGVSVVSLAIGTVLWLTRPNAPSGRTARTP